MKGRDGTAIIDASTPEFSFRRQEERGTKMNETLGGDARTRQYFDAIDKAHELLENHKDLSKAIPSCVVVGMQSVGKSAVLSRISGIPFPQDSEVCTRVAMELRLRRCSNGKADTNITAGTSPVPIDADSNECIEGALKKAQSDVLNGRKFEDKVSVKINKTGTDLPEVTLVDLPGVFFAKTEQADDLEDRVKAMIAERVHNEMALICHVVPLNQDTDTISTWRIVHDADKDQSRTISILTKADLAIENGKESLKNRIIKIVGESNSSECFIIHGAATDPADEESQLSMVRDYVGELRLTGRIQIGVQALNAYIEERMLNHIKERIPVMKRLLQAEVGSCKSELAKIGREAISPLAIAFRDIHSITEAIHLSHSEHRHKRRKLTEEMSDNIFKIKMEPFGIVDFEESKELIRNNYNSRKYDTPNDDMYNLHALAVEVKQFEEVSREHINVPFVGKETELTRWARQFARPCSEIAEKYTEDAFNLFCKHILRPSLDTGCSEATKQVRREVEAALMQVVAEKRDEALKRVREVGQSMGRNFLTTNSHYFVETAAALKSEHEEKFGGINGPYRSEMKPHFHTVYDILAFIKTRKKFVPDAVQGNTIRLLDELLEETKKIIQGTMVKESSLDLIKEPASIERRRKFNLDRENQIEKVFNEINFL